MRALAEITPESAKSRVPQKQEEAKEGRGWKIHFPKPSPDKHLQLFKILMQQII